MSLEQTLTAASSDLLMPSESDYPFFCWQGQAQEDLTTEKLLQLTSNPTDSQVEIIDLDYLFSTRTSEHCS
jgi:hypothetical protein